MNFKRSIFMAAALVSAAAIYAPIQAMAQNAYPENYSELVEASKAEQGLLVYSNIGELNWQPILSAFNAKYDWIDVTTLDLGGSEIFQRYYAEQAISSSGVDIVLTSQTLEWADFVASGNAVDYQSPEAANLPEWAHPLPGLYTISADPLVLVYNKLLLPEAEWPTSLEQLAGLASQKPEEFNKRVATMEPFNNSVNTSQLSHYVSTVGKEAAIANFSVLGPISDVYRSGGPIFEKLMSGEYIAGYNLSTAQLVPLLSDPARASLIGWAYPTDGTIVSPRHFAIAKTAKSPNAARLFTDFLLSKEGQEAVSAGGLVPYRSGLDLQADGIHDKLNLEYLSGAVPADRIVMTTLDPELAKGSDELVTEVNAAFAVP